MTDEQKRDRAEEIAANDPDPKKRAMAHEWLQTRWPDIYGPPPPSHPIPTTPEQDARIARGQAAGTAPGSRTLGQINPPTFRDNMAAALGVDGSQDENPGTDAFRGVRNMANGYTMGISGALTDRLGLDSPAARAGEHPRLGQFEHMVGGLEGAMSRTGPVGLVGRGAEGLVGMAERQVPALARTAVGRVVGHGATGALAGAGVSGGEALVAGGDLAKIASAAGSGALWGGPLALLGAGLGAAGRYIANRRYAADPTLPQLEKGGYTTTPLPGQATVSTAQHPEAGEPHVPSSPSEAVNLPATASSRGQLAREAADEIQDEVSHLRKGVKARTATELEAATGKQGGRSLSVEDDIRLIDEELAKPGPQMYPQMRTILQNAKRMLLGELEPTLDLYETHPPLENPRAPAPGALERYQDLRTQRQIGLELERGTGPGELVREPPLPEPLSATPQTVPIGDVRARVGEAPNHVRSAGELNQIRDALDSALSRETFERGVSKEALPIFRLSNQMRQRIRTEAPALGLANRRANAATTKLERTEARLKGKVDDSESLTDQIANQLNPESSAAGAREARLGPAENIPLSRRRGNLGVQGDRGDLNLRAQFPQGRLSGDRINDLLNTPRELAAEEAQYFKPTLNPKANIRPLANRVLYPIARGAAVAAGSEVAPTLRSILREPPPGSAPGYLPLVVPQIYPVFDDPRGLAGDAAQLVDGFQSLFRPPPRASNSRRRAQ